MVQLTQDTLLFQKCKIHVNFLLGSAHFLSLWKASSQAIYHTTRGFQHLTIQQHCALKPYTQWSQIADNDWHVIISRVNWLITFIIFYNFIPYIFYIIIKFNLYGQEIII